MQTSCPPRTAEIRRIVSELAERIGSSVRLLVAKPGLDGHSNGAEQIAVRAADCGFEVTYEGIRLTPEQIVELARRTDSHAIGLSILSGSHIPLVRDIMSRLRRADLDRIPVVVGGIIPPEDALVLRQLGVARVYTPKDYDLNLIMTDLVKLVESSERVTAI
jgi:(2R)-ethylmalonyl-CoA mutase